MVIIEGPDGAGKSTLAQKLSAILNISIHHSGGPPRSNEEILHRQYIMNTGIRLYKPLIYDRAACISDPIYGKIIRGHSPFDDEPHFRKDLKWLLTNMELIIIYCRPPTDHLIEMAGRDQSHKKGYKPADHVRGVHQGVRSIVRMYDESICDFPHVTYDFTQSGSNLTVGDISHLLVSRLEQYCRGLI